MNRRGFGAIGFLILFGFLIFMWPFVLAPLFTVAGQNAVAGGATGLEAFLWTNLNLWFFLILVVVVIVYLRYGGES